MGSLGCGEVPDGRVPVVNVDTAVGVGAVVAGRSVEEDGDRLRRKRDATVFEAREERLVARCTEISNSSFRNV